MSPSSPLKHRGNYQRNDRHQFYQDVHRRSGCILERIANRIADYRRLVRIGSFAPQITHFNVLLGSTNLFGGWIRGRDETIEVSALVDKKYDLGFAEVNQVVYPWLIGLMRYERAEPDNAESLERVVTGFTALYRANIKFVAETAFDPSDIELSTFNFKVDFAL